LKSRQPSRKASRRSLIKEIPESCEMEVIPQGSRSRNGAGIIHTTDPFGAERCPEIIATWPAELREVTRFYPLSSMDFFLELERQKVALDMVLVEGNHDYEFASFDLLMAARSLRPGGIVVMDNAEQSGPFHAARTFLGANPS
jgi:hypothetical protein